MKEDSDLTNVARKSTFILAIKLAVVVLSYIGFMFIARYMGAEIVGMIGFALGLVGVLFQTDFGFGKAHNKMISAGEDPKECLGTYIQIKLILTLLFTGTLLGGMYVWENVLGHGYEDPMIRSVIFLILGYYILFGLSKIAFQTFGGLRQSAKQQMPELIGTAARVPIMFYVAIASLSVVALAFSYVVSGFMMLLIGILWLRKFEVSRPTKKRMKAYAVFAAPVAIYSVFSAVSLNIDKVAIQLFWNATEVGYFYGMQRVTIVMTMLALSLVPILFPSVSHFHANRRLRKIRELLSTAERYISMILVPMVVVFCILSEPVIHIMVGDEFLPATIVLAILSIYALFFSLNIPHIQTLYGCNKPKLGARVGISIALTNTVLLFILVPREIFGFQLFGWGAEGAAMASLLSVIVGFLLSRYYTRRLVKVRFRGEIAKHWLAGIVMAIFFIFLSDYYYPSRWFDLIIFIAGGLLCYLGIMIAIKEFTKKDVFFFLDLLNFKKMKNYLRGELKS
ncbi:MAG: polysaccharide biosynthesis C-terminal domain-containing protein [Thermoplasmata archaeon]|nr:polysaccharide biosynthesis C-terminal domain-containing protein [Thermoplasmata archaeon]